jgi:hypothetical protein
MKIQPRTETHLAALFLVRKELMLILWGYPLLLERKVHLSSLLLVVVLLYVLTFVYVHLASFSKGF